MGLPAASSSDAYRAEVEWYGRIRDAHRKGFTPAGVLTLFSRDPVRSAKARGLLPSQALAELAADQDTEGKGRPLPGSLAEAPNADVVKALAKCS
ncbi:hypothetical protein [Streptomyces mexicanus]|uniref:hypothetical protein n=1 Tax=Streptomyces mexicanus TaxID=178566 RepID=UPI0036A32951